MDGVAFAVSVAKGALLALLRCLAQGFSRSWCVQQDETLLTQPPVTGFASMRLGLARKRPLGSQGAPAETPRTSPVVRRLSLTEAERLRRSRKRQSARAGGAFNARGSKHANISTGTPSSLRTSIRSPSSVPQTSSWVAAQTSRAEASARELLDIRPASLEAGEEPGNQLATSPRRSLSRP